MPLPHGAGGHRRRVLPRTSLPQPPDPTRRSSRLGVVRAESVQSIFGAFVLTPLFTTCTATRALQNKTAVAPNGDYFLQTSQVTRHFITDHGKSLQNSEHAETRCCLPTLALTLPQRAQRFVIRLGWNRAFLPHIAHHLLHVPYKIADFGSKESA